MNFNQNFRVKFDITMIFFYFCISEDSFGHHLSQIWHFYLLQQQSWAVLSMTAPSNEMFQNLYSKTHAFSFNASIVFLFTFYEKCISFLLCWLLKE